MTTDYAALRPTIKTGDLVGVATQTAFAKLTRAAQWVGGLEHYTITHAAVAVWMGDRLYVAEMNAGGNVYKPLSQYEGMEIIVRSPPKGTNLAKLPAAIVKATNTHTPYGFFDLARIGVRVSLRRVFDTARIGRDGGADQVCSFFAAQIYKSCGADVSGWPNMPAPAELFESEQQ